MDISLGHCMTNLRTVPTVWTCLAAVQDGKKANFVDEGKGSYLHRLKMLTKDLSKSK